MDNNHDSNYLLTSEFFLYPQKMHVIAKLTETSIIITRKNGKPESQVEVINLKDVTGCHVSEGNCSTPAKWHLCVFVYPLKKKLLKGQIRQRISRSLGAGGSKTEEENKLTTTTWKRAIKHLITGRCVNHAEVNNLPDLECRNLVVYINPFSGQGKAMQIYKKHVKKMFAEAEIKHTVVKTEYAGHARHLARDLNLASCDGIVIVSGDGLIHEVVNGLMDRNDWKIAIQTPIGIVPGGSGNALAAAIVYASTGQHASLDLVTDSMFEIIKGRSRDLSLVYIQSQSSFYFSFLNVGWGFVADVDIESEKFRGLGNARFTLGCAVRIASYRKYHGMVSYLPLEKSGIINNGSKTQTTIGTSFKTKTLAETNWNNSSSAGIRSEESGYFSSKNTKIFHISSSLHESLPNEWKSIEEEFVWVMPVYLSHVGQDMFMMPNAKLDEDVIYLYCLKSGVGRAQLLNILLNIADGTHLNISSENTLVVPCRAFRLEPFTNKTGLLTVDGEAVSYEPIQATVTPIKSRIMCSSC
uniref:sphingosine kinase n=1 Tax=Phallusia mammillata TaxID=59560 RepID=A0A6F9DTM8_9ASCI|nr:sphingosine kinase 2 [Phallusia mammillata]